MQTWILRWPEKVLFWAVVGMLILLSGCCGPRGALPGRNWFIPCEPAQCGMGNCAEECGGYGGGLPSSAEADLACQGCLPSLPPPASCYPGPLSWLFARIVWPYYPGFAGCGQRYWSPWVADPPDCCDPCDGYGQWMGAPKGTGYSSMYPNVFPGGVSPALPRQTEPGAISPVSPQTRPGCSECGKGHQARSFRIPPGAQSGPRHFMDSQVYPTGYSNLAQRPRQGYRDPATR